MKRTIISLVVAALFAGCAAVPQCKSIDVPEIGELVERMQALEAGSCTLKGG